jgi:hypothetical protein
MRKNSHRTNPSFTAFSLVFTRPRKWMPIAASNTVTREPDTSADEPTGKVKYPIGE